MTQAAMKALERKKALENKATKQDWREKKIQFKFETAKQTKEPLQIAINKIARLLDADLPCLARPFEYSQNYDAGHINGAISFSSSLLNNPDGTIKPIDEI